MIDVDPALTDQLQRLNISIQKLDGDTLLLRNVPANARFFSKPKTNLLLKRPRGGLPFITGVDEDLRYTGPDPEVGRLFNGEIRREGWQLLPLPMLPGASLDEAVHQALATLGSDGREPVAARPGAPRAEDRFQSQTIDLTARVIDGRAEPTVGREAQIERAAACLIRWGQQSMPLLVGPSGVGKTNLLQALARRLLTCRPDWRLHALDLGVLFSGTLFASEREHLLEETLRHAAGQPGTVLVLEHFDLLAAEAFHGPTLVVNALDSGLRLAATVLAAEHATLPEALARRIEPIYLPEPSAADCVAILAAVGEAIGAHHRVTIDPQLLPMCLSAARGLAGCLPGKAIALLDAAVARASLGASAALGPDDLLAAAAVMEKK